MTDTAHIEALWLEPGTAADAAMAANMRRTDGKKISAEGVREIWERAKAEGRLPPFSRPMNGFNEDQKEILSTYIDIRVGKAA